MSPTEKVIGGGYLGDVGRAPPGRRLTQCAARPKLIVRAGDEMGGARIGGRRELVEDVEHRCRANPSFDALVGARKGHVGAEAVAAKDETVVGTQAVEHGYDIDALGLASAVFAGGGTGTPEVEPHGPPPRSQRAINHGRNHGVMA